MTSPPVLPPSYQFVRLLGSGAFGDVSLARHVGLGRLVAIKRLHAYAMADDDALERFRREATVLAALRSREIVRVWDFVSADSGAFLIMEYVEGRDLSAYLRRTRLAAEQALPILSDVAQALDAAARAGVVHRDVKPGNVLVLSDGHAKLGDFGLARVRADERIFRTAGGVIAGTPAYFPPETGLGAEPDARSDAYSFAVMAYEVLTGRLPIEADDPMIMVAAHRTRPVPRPESVVAGFPAAAADALLAGLAKDPARRPLPVDLVARLRQVAAHEWPPAGDRPGEPGGPDDAGGSARTASTRLVIPSSTGEPLAGGGALRRSSTRRRAGRRWWVAVGLLVAAAVGIALVVTMSRPHATPAPLRIRGIAVTSAPRDGTGSCPRTTFRVTAEITTNGRPGVLTVTFALFGRRTSARPITLSQGQGAVRVHALFPVRGAQARTGSSVVSVTVGAAVTRSADVVRYRC